MTGALLSFCAMAVAIRKLWGPLSIMEILALRAALGLAIIGIVAAFRPDERRSITMRRLPLHILRNSVHFGAQYLWALGLVLLPLATVFALEFTVPAIAGIGAAGLFAHFCLSNAFRAGDASVVVPLDFLRIPLIAVIGWWLYAEPLDVFVFAGAGLIISGILWNLRSEMRPAAPLPTPAAKVKTG